MTLSNVRVMKPQGVTFRTDTRIAHIGPYRVRLTIEDASALRGALTTGAEWIEVGFLLLHPASGVVIAIEPVDDTDMTTRIFDFTSHGDAGTVVKIH